MTAVQVSDTVSKISIPSRLTEALKEKRCVLFVGPGISTGPEGLLSDVQLARKLAQHSGLCRCKHMEGPNDCDGLECCCRWPLQRLAQYYVLEEGSPKPLIDFLTATIETVHQPLSIHLAVARLHSRFSAVVTTSYDQLLERAFEEIGSKCVPVIEDEELSYVGNKPIVYKLYGCISRPKTILITEAHFLVSPFNKQNLIANKLKGYLADHAALFLGYNVEDSTFRELYREIRRYLANRSFTAFAICNSPTEPEVSYWKNNNLEILDFDELTFLKQIETELTLGASEALSVLHDEVEIFRTNKAYITNKGKLEVVREKLGVLRAQALLTNGMKELLARSGMHWYPEPGIWVDLIPDREISSRITKELLASDNRLAQENAALLAGQEKLEDAVPELIKLLYNRNVSVRNSASQALAEIGNDTVAESLLELAGDKFKAFLALKAFSDLPVEVAVPVFQSYFSSATVEERRTMLGYFADLHEESTETIVRCIYIALESTDSALFELALGLLENISLDAAADCLGKFAFSTALQDRRGKAVWSLGHLRTQRALEHLEVFLAKDEAQTYEAAIGALRLILSPRKHSTLEDEQVRRTATTMLVKTEDRSSETLSLIQELTRDDDDQIRKEIVQNLGKFLNSDEILNLSRDILSSPRRLTPEDDQVRRLLVTMLTETRDRSSETLELFRKLTGDNDKEIRTMAQSWIREEFYASFIFAVRDDKKETVGTGFFVSSHDESYVITCAHVIKSIHKTEGQTVNLKHFDNEIGEFEAEVLWCRPPEESNQKHWSAKEDVSILKIDLSLPEEIAPLSLEDPQHHQAEEECWCFGYPTARASRGDWITKILCESKIGDGFIELVQTGESKITPGVSGAPLSDNQGKIIGMVQASDEKKEFAFLIPSKIILEVLSSLTENS